MRAPDSTLALRADPYRFVRGRCRAEGTDAFRTRLLLQRTLCMTGPEAARFFYDGEIFTRAGAAPGFLTATLFGEGGVQALDGAEHAHRKAMFLDLFGPGRTDALTAAAAAAIEALLRGREPVVLQDRLEEVLTRVVCDWAGVPLPGSALRDRSRMLSHLFEHAASVDIRQILARRARRRAERWIGGVIEDVRSGRLSPPPGSALAVVAGWRTPGGDLLALPVASVELLNMLRPFVAISSYLTFAAHALATEPGQADALRADPARLPHFVQEVRRTYPFFPLLVARARCDTAWRGHEIRKGERVALDIWGTNRDPSAWTDPDSFSPRRFEGWRGDPFTLVPQGGGGHAAGHRCPGEWVTRDLMEAATRSLLRIVDWSNLPEQDLRLDMRNLPGLPRDRMILRAAQS